MPNVAPAVSPTRLYLPGGLTPGEVGGALVRRPCRVAGADRRIGDQLTDAELASIPVTNLRALVEQRFIVVWPRASRADAAPPGEPFVVPVPGTNRFSVVVGVPVNPAPLSRTEAEALAVELRARAAA